MMPLNLQEESDADAADIENLFCGGVMYGYAYRMTYLKAIRMELPRKCAG